MCLRAVKVIKSIFFSLKVKRRIQALTNIADHVATIHGPTLMLEQNFYLNIEKLTEHVAKKLNFFIEAEQMRYQLKDAKIALRINTNRYTDSVMPSWFS